MNSIKLIQSLSNAPGASGFEHEVVEVIKKESQGYAVRRDSMNNCYITGEIDPNKPTLMLDAHSDEVSFMVQFIEDNGLIRFLNLGNWIPSNVPAHLVNVINEDNENIRGIIGSKPPHFMSEKEKKEALTIQSLFIDIGANSREEVIEKYKIDIGAPIVPHVTFEYNEMNNLMMGKAFDNRLGCAAVIKIMDNLKNADLNINVVGAIASQEEVGLRGAKVTAQTIKPDIAIVFEGSPSDDRFRSKTQAQCILGAGPQLRHRDRSMISNPNLIKLIKASAREQGIIIQNAVRTAGGTNGGSIHLAEQGIPTAVLGIPTRYIHTHYCYANLNDFEETVTLVTNFIKSLKPEDISRL